MDPILAAIKWADRDEHEGAGYSLRILTMGGVFDIHVFQTDGLPYLLRRHAPGTIYDRVEMFFNPANVESVTVLW